MLHPTDDGHELHLRRLAAQVIVMLPENPRDARTVLAYALEMYDRCIMPGCDRREDGSMTDGSVALFPPRRTPR